MYQRLPAFLDNPRMFTRYPEMAVGIARDLFTVDGGAPEPMRKKSCVMQRKSALSI